VLLFTARLQRFFAAAVRGEIQVEAGEARDGAPLVAVGSAMALNPDDAAVGPHDSERVLPRVSARRHDCIE
jgi:hypothetical protein